MIVRRNFIQKGNLFSLAFIWTVCLYGQKTDIVTLKNGDRITGEVKRLDLEILQLKTSSMSTASIKWHHVSTILAPSKKFEFLLKDKSKLSGSLDSIKIPEALKINTNEGEFNVKTSEVVTIYQVRRRFWRRFSGNLSAGVNFTKASQVLQYNFSGALSYVDEDYFGSLSVSSINTDQEGEASTAKQDVLLNINKTIRSKEFATVFVGAQKNSELGIERRTQGGLGYGRDMIHSNVARIRVVAGLTGNQETLIEDNSSTNNMEGLLSLDGRVFKYTDPEVYLTSTVNYYPSITVTGRHRLEIEIQLRFELFNNFFIDLRVYDNYDSKPASTTASSNDYGILSGLSYTFGL